MNMLDMFYAYSSAVSWISYYHAVLCRQAINTTFKLIFSSGGKQNLGQLYEVCCPTNLDQSNICSQV
jgi:hypothetical protein